MVKLKVTEFYNQLKGKVLWDEKSHSHWLGSNVLTNKDMHTMCSHYFGKQYDLLPSGLQRQVRESIFYKLRYGKYKDE